MGTLAVQGAGLRGQRAVAVGGACAPADLAAADSVVVDLAVAASVEEGFGADDKLETDSANNFTHPSWTPLKSPLV